MHFHRKIASHTLVRIAGIAAVAGCMLMAMQPLGAGAASYSARSNNPWVGTWTRHGFSLNVSDDGSAVANWRTYQWCDATSSGPCDAMVGNQIVSGGYASLQFNEIDGNAATGETVVTNDDSVVGDGRVSLTLLPYDMARLDTNGQSFVLCGPLFAQSAPQSVLDSAPCGA